MNRNESIQRLRQQQKPWDIVVIGGGATGVGIALDAATRGHTVALFEQADFGKGTSSRSTKLIHGGVRYLEQGNITLVMEALKERGILKRNAPHLVSDLEFVVPNYSWWEAPFYGIGLKIYDLLAGRYGFGKSKYLSSKAVLEMIPTLERDNLKGGIVYHDGQFDDTRLLISLARTATQSGACLINYAEVLELKKDAAGVINGLTVQDKETGEKLDISARSVVNATGAFCDSIRKMDEPNCSNIIAPSMGVHIVLPRKFLPGKSAIMVPHTRDGRVMFAIPWHDHVLIGTTDSAVITPELEPTPLSEDIDFILSTAANYLEHPPKRSDILSVFAGIRPLIQTKRAENTASLSRGHTINVSSSGLLSIAGGKWTTYRNMAEDVVDHLQMLAALPDNHCVTSELKIHGWAEGLDPNAPLTVYGSEIEDVKNLAGMEPELLQPLHKELPTIGAQVIWAARLEMARTVEDILARRTRALFLNAKAAVEMAPIVARLLGDELGLDSTWQEKQVREFSKIAENYLPK